MNFWQFSRRFGTANGQYMLAQLESGAHMPNGQPNGREGKNLCTRGQNWAGLSQGEKFRAGLGGPKYITISIRAGWAAHFLMGFFYVKAEKSRKKTDFGAPYL